MLGFGKKKGETAAGGEVGQGEAKRGLVGRLREQLSRTRSSLGGELSNLLLGRKRVDEDLLEELETLLLMADVGVEATTRIIADLSARVKRR
jgi:fused signal recognition particle receptor